MANNVKVISEHKGFPFPMRYLFNARFEPEESGYSSHGMKGRTRSPTVYPRNAIAHFHPVGRAGRMMAMIPSDCGENITSTSWTSRVGALTPRSEGVRCFIRLRLDDEMDASFVAPDEPCEELVRPSRLVVVGVRVPDVLDEDVDDSACTCDLRRFRWETSGRTLGVFKREVA